MAEQTDSIENLIERAKYFRALEENKAGTDGAANSQPVIMFTLFQELAEHIQHLEKTLLGGDLSPVVKVGT